MLPCVWIAITLFPLRLKAGPEFQVLYSKPLAVYVFVKKLNSEQATNGFRQLFDTSRFATTIAKEKLKVFGELCLDYSYSYEEYPYGSKVMGMTEALLKKNMIASATVSEFRIRSIGMIPNETLYQLCDILSYFEPIYQSLVYDKYGAGFENQMKEIAKGVSGEGVPDCFEKATMFYGTTWNKEVPFQICLYPLPLSKGFSAEALYNQAVCGVPSDVNKEVLLSVMLHEVFHMLYDEQSLQLKKDLSTWFSSQSSDCRQYAYLLLNEVLATAIGNGYSYKRLTGKIDEGDWYDWPYINLMAKKLYPMVADYLQHGRSMDKAFVTSYINLYETNFKTWLQEPRHTFCFRAVLSDNRKDLELVASRYPNCSLSESQTEISNSSIEQMMSRPLTKLIIISNDHEKQINLLKQFVPELRTITLDPKKESVRRLFLKDKTNLYLVIQHQSSTGQMLDKLEEGVR